MSLMSFFPYKSGHAAFKITQRRNELLGVCWTASETAAQGAEWRACSLQFHLVAFRSTPCNAQYHYQVKSEVGWLIDTCSYLKDIS